MLKLKPQCSCPAAARILAGPAWMATSRPPWEHSWSSNVATIRVWHLQVPVFSQKKKAILCPLFFGNNSFSTWTYRSEKCEPLVKQLHTIFLLEPTCIRVDRVTFTLNMWRIYMRLLVYTGKTPLYNASVKGDILLHMTVYMWGLRGRYFLTPPSPCPRMYKSAQPFWLENDELLIGR